jgi:thiol-disulfide isomerase/thioredoxin
MKTRILTAAICILSCTANAQQKLTMIDQDYELAKTTAAQQQKLLIIDFYTTWCIPCKELDKKIFQNDSISQKIGTDFIVLRYDAEKDAVHNLSLKHHIASYPTTIVLSPTGNVIRKMYGTGGEAALITNYTRLLQESIALNRSSSFIPGVAAAIDTTIYPAFYKKYVRRIADIGPSDLADFWKSATDLKAERSFDILAYFGRAPEHVVDYFLRNKAGYEALYGQADVKFVLNNIVSEKFSAAVTAKNETAYAAAKKFARTQLSADEAARVVNAYDLDMQMATSKWQNAADLIEQRIRQKAMNENGINAFCWAVYETCGDKQVIGRAVRMMKDVVEQNPQFATLDTYARLLSKSGNKDAAKEAMARAIALGKAAGEDTGESEEAMLKF